MQSRSIRRSGQPTCAIALSNASFWSGPNPRRGIMASGHVNRVNRPNTWLHRPMLQREESPCQPGAVHTWHIAAPDVCDSTSAVGESRHRIPGASVDQPTEPCLGGAKRQLLESYHKASMNRHRIRHRIRRHLDRRAQPGDAAIRALRQQNDQRRRLPGADDSFRVRLMSRDSGAPSNVAKPARMIPP